MGDIDQIVGRVGRGFDHEGGDAAAWREAGARFGQAGGDFGGPRVGGEFHTGNAELRQHLHQQGLGAAIDRGVEEHRVAGAGDAEQGGGDGGHAAGEDERGLRPFPDGETVFEDFQIGVVETAIDQAGLFAGVEVAQAGDELEEFLAVLGGAEDEGAGLEDRHLDRAFREGGVVAEAHHQGFRVQRVPGEFAFVVVHARTLPV